jgi:hypothetical protein
MRRSEEGTVPEDRSGFTKSFVVGVHKNPNPVGGIATRWQYEVTRPIVELYKFLHTGFVEKHSAVGHCLECGGEPEYETTQENTKEKDRLP